MEYIISNSNKASALSEINDYFQALEPDEVFKVVIKSLRGKRSTDQNSLFHVWMPILAEHFTKRGYPINKDEMKKLMKHKYLGYESQIIGNTVIPDQLRHTKSLDVGEMFEFMQKVDMWAVEHGCFLPRPEDSEFSHLMERENAA